METIMSAINVQVEAKDKEQATIILKDLGINMSTFINMAIKQVIKQDGLPFTVSNPRPNKELLEALEEGENIATAKIESKGYHNVKDMIEDILNED